MLKLDRIKNTLTALITPFNEKFEIDWDKLKTFLKFQIDNGVGLVPMGTTGESATLTHEEHHKVIEFTINEANGKTPVIAGTGSNSTSEAIS